MFYSNPMENIDNLNHPVSISTPKIQLNGSDPQDEPTSIPNGSVSTRDFEIIDQEHDTDDEQQEFYEAPDHDHNNVIEPEPEFHQHENGEQNQHENVENGQPEPELERYNLRNRSAMQLTQRYDDFIQAAVADVNNLPKDPETYKQDLDSPYKEKWLEAMLSEINSLHENQTWN